MHRMMMPSLCALGLIAAAPAWAEDKDPCPAGMVCASDPASVKAALGKAHLKADLTTDNTGDPLISGDNGYKFDVYFYGCADHKNCDSLRFEIMFGMDPTNTPVLANKWNDIERFIQMSATDDGKLRGL